MPRVPTITRRERLPTSVPLPTFSATTSVAAGISRGVVSLGRLGGALIDRELIKLQRTADFNFVSESTSAVQRQVAEAFATAQREGDATDPMFSQNLMTRFGEFGEAALADPRGASSVAQAQARARIEGIKTRAFEGALRVQGQALRARAIDNVQGSVNDIGASFRQGESLEMGLLNLAGVLASADGALDDPTLLTLRARARTQLVAGAVTAAIERGNLAEARRLLADKRFNRDLTPAQRGTLTRGIRIAQRRSEAVSRDIIEQAANYEDNIGRGGTRDPATEITLQQALGAKRGDRFIQDVDRAELVRSTIEESATLPLAEIDANLAKIRPNLNDPANTRADNAAFDAIQKGLGEMLKARARDPAGFFVPEVERLVAERFADGSLLDPSGISDPDERAAAEAQIFNTRQRLNEQLQRGVGFRDVIPIPLVAVKTFTDRIETGTPQDAATALRDAEKQFGANAVRQLVGEIKGRNAGLALAVEFSTKGRAGRDLMADIVAGQRALRDNKDLAPKATDLTAALDANFGELFARVPELRAMFAQAARNLFAQAVLGGANADSQDTVNQAVKRAAGAVERADGTVAGGVAKIGGGLFSASRQILLPFGVSEDQFDLAVSSITDNDLVDARGGRPVFATGRAVTADQLRRDGKLISVGFGRFIVELGGGLLQSEAGGAYVLDVAEFIEQNPPVVSAAAPPAPDTEPRVSMAKLLGDLEGLRREAERDPDAPGIGRRIELKGKQIERFARLRDRAAKRLRGQR